jgi:hypothetical protein
LDERHHHYFIYFTQEGKKTAVKTKTSHGTGSRDISDNLLGQMARQCHLVKKQFLELIDCPLSQDMYELILQEAGIIETSTNTPFMPESESSSSNSHSPTNTRFNKKTT